MEDVMTRLLEVGDVLFADLNSGMIKRTVTKVTKTKAVVQGFDLHREVMDDWSISVKGRNDIWNTPVFQLATPELELKFNKIQILHTISTNISNMLFNIEAVKHKVKKVNIEDLNTLKDSMIKINEEMTRLVS
jgi:hypothetical protein